MTTALAKKAVALFHLEPDARAFFYATLLAHIALKLGLGLFLALEDGYGLDSLVAPPRSLVLVGADGLTCFAFAKLLDLAVPPRLRFGSYVAAFALLWPFLVTSFIVHTYFKAWINQGLIAFNGAGVADITDYAIAGLNRYSLAFIAAMTLAFAWFFASWPRLTAGSAARSSLGSRADLRAERRPAWLLALCAVLFGYAGTLSAGQSGWLIPNPAYALVRSYTWAKVEATPRAGAAELARFHEPRAPVFGRYESALDVTVQPRPGANVLWLLFESLPFEQTTLGGGKGLPVLEELAREGVSFSQFRTVFPATSRSFITYHCGVYPTTGPSTVTKYLPSYRCDSLLAPLRERNYRTGFFTAPLFTYDNLHHSELLTDYDVKEHFTTLQRSTPDTAGDAPAVSEEVVSAALLDFLRQDRERAFFATYFLYWDHAPYRLPHEDISGLPALERYQRTLGYLDGIVRTLLADMREEGLLENTIVVASADHGEGFALHHDNKNHGGHIYEDDVHIPFVIHLPGLGAHPTARQGSNLDFAPTLAYLLDVPRASSWRGQNLLGTDYQPRPHVLFGRASFATRGLIDGSLKYIAYDDAPPMLFDLASDPHEQHDLAARSALRVAKYTSLLDPWFRVIEAQAFAVHENNLVARAPSTAQRR